MAGSQWGLSSWSAGGCLPPAPSHGRPRAGEQARSLGSLILSCDPWLRDLDSTKSHLQTLSHWGFHHTNWRGGGAWRNSVHSKRNFGKPLGSEARQLWANKQTGNEAETMDYSELAVKGWCYESSFWEKKIISLGNNLLRHLFFPPPPDAKWATDIFFYFTHLII